MQDSILCWTSVHWIYMSLIFSVIKAIDGFPLCMNNDQRCVEKCFRKYADCVQAGTGSIPQRDDYPAELLSCRAAELLNSNCTIRSFVL